VWDNNGVKSMMNVLLLGESKRTHFYDEINTMMLCSVTLNEFNTTIKRESMNRINAHVSARLFMNTLALRIQSYGSSSWRLQLLTISWLMLVTPFTMANTKLGDNALYMNSSGSQNTALGAYALFTNGSGSNNTAVGRQSLYKNTTGAYNVALGSLSLYSSSTGAYNVASGSASLFHNTTGNNNVASGFSSLYMNTTGSENIALGRSALVSNTTGIQNIGLGYQAGYLNQTGSRNIFLGYEAGYSETSSDKLYIDNSRTAAPLIYGDFASDALTINGTLNSTGNISTSGTLTAAGNVIAPAFYHTDGTKMLSIQDGSIHLGASSMIFTDSSVSGNADIMHSSSGKIQLGKNATDSTTVIGSLNVETPTQDSHAANKAYVDKVAGNNAVDVDALHKDMRRYDSRSVALSSALTALPTNGGTGSHACGIGAGVRGEYSAMAMGCAADLENFELPDALPSFIKNASINAGTSFLTHDDPDYTFKVGMSFNFGGSKSRPSASHLEADFARELALVHQKTQRTANKQAEAIKKVQRDNLRLLAKVNAMSSDKAELLALRTEVDGLKKDKAEMLVMKEQLVQLTALIAGTEMVAAKWK